MNCDICGQMVRGKIFSCNASTIYCEPSFSIEGHEQCINNVDSKVVLRNRKDLDNALRNKKLYTKAALDEVSK